VNTKETITHIFPLSKVDEAFKTRNNHRGDTIHVMIDCEVDETNE
jgi:L-iditol 2-dehydrogenase